MTKKGKATFFVFCRTVASSQHSWFAGTRCLYHFVCYKWEWNMQSWVGTKYFSCRFFLIWAMDSLFLETSNLLEHVQRALASFERATSADQAQQIEGHICKQLDLVSFLNFLSKLKNVFYGMTSNFLFTFLSLEFFRYSEIASDWTSSWARNHRPGDETPSIA